MSIEVNEFLASGKNRRNFIRNLGLATAAAGVVASPMSAQTTTGPTDVDILNFALNLEYLEAEFYTMATSGLTIDKFEYSISGGSLSGTAGATTGGAKVTFTDSTIFDVALELADDERTHVALLQGAIASLGGTAVAKPAINLNALGIGYASQAQFLTLARAFEEIGVTAYGGAAPLITNKTILGYAARILAAEAEHVGYIRSLLVQHNVTVSALDPVDIIPPPSASNSYFVSQFFSLNSNALSAVRSPGEVLLLAYGGAAGATSGGFFPAGMNGTLNMSANTPAVTDGATFTLNPSPIISASGYGSTTISWTAPAGVTQVSIRLGSPAGPYFIYGGASGSMTTPGWVQDGLVFYLQNASNLATEQMGSSTLAIAIARVLPAVPTAF